MIDQLVTGHADQPRHIHHLPSRDPIGHRPRTRPGSAPPPSPGHRPGWPDTNRPRSRCACTHRRTRPESSTGTVTAAVLRITTYIVSHFAFLPVTTKLFRRNLTASRWTPPRTPQQPPTPIATNATDLQAHPTRQPAAKQMSRAAPGRVGVVAPSTSPADPGCSVSGIHSRILGVVAWKRDRKVAGSVAAETNSTESTAGSMSHDFTARTPSPIRPLNRAFAPERCTRRVT